MIENIFENVINIEKGNVEKLELIFDNYINNNEIDLTPNFPIVINY